MSQALAPDLEAVTIDCLASVTERPRQIFETMGDRGFEALGVDSVALLSVLLKLEEHLSGDLGALDDITRVPATLGDLVDIAGRLAATRSAT